MWGPDREERVMTSRYGFGRIWGKRTHVRTRPDGHSDSCDRWGPFRVQGANSAMTTFRYAETIRRPPARPLPRVRPLKIVLSGLPSDSHAWNLVALQVILEGMGHRVVNLGARVAVDRVLEVCRREVPDCLVLSTVNGSGGVDGARLIGRLRADVDLAALTAVIGGRFSGRYPGADARAEMLGLGFDEAFPVGAGDPGNAVASLREFVAARAR